jgi:hypothetical protein
MKVAGNAAVVVAGAAVVAWAVGRGEAAYSH